MDYNDNDYQSQNLHLAGEDSSKVSSVLHPYALPKFDFDDSLQGHLRFDSLVENEVFLGIPSQEDNQWIDDFSRGSSGIEFSSSAADSCSIPRRNNVWSEATSSESVEMLLKSVGQEEMVPGDTIIEDSDAGNESGGLTQPMEPSLKLDDKRDDVKESSLVAQQDTFTGAFSTCDRSAGEGIHITCTPEMQYAEPLADGSSDIVGQPGSDVITDEKLQIDFKRNGDNLGEDKSPPNESLLDKSDRGLSVSVLQVASNECSTDSLSVCLEKLNSQDNLTDCHHENTSGLPDDHNKPEEEPRAISKELSMADEKLCGSAVESETCTSNTSSLSLAASDFEVVKELSTEIRMTQLEESTGRQNECSLTIDGCKEDTCSVEPPMVSSSVMPVFPKDLKDKIRAEGNSILCEEASVVSRSHHGLEMRDTEDQENVSKPEKEKVSVLQISDGQSTSTDKDDNILDSDTSLLLGTPGACMLSEVSEPPKQIKGNGIYSPDNQSITKDASVSAELVAERPVYGSDADGVAKEDICPEDQVFLPVPAESMDICGEVFPQLVDVGTTKEDASGSMEVKEVLPVENETGGAPEHEKDVGSFSVGEQPEQITDQSHGSEFEFPTLNKQELNAENTSLISGGKSVGLSLLSGSGAIASGVADHDNNQQPVSVMVCSVHLAEKEEMEVDFSAEAQLSTLKESSEVAGLLCPLATAGEDASGHCPVEIAHVMVDQNVEGNPNAASQVEQATIAETNNECSRLCVAGSNHSGSTVEEGDVDPLSASGHCPVESTTVMVDQNVSMQGNPSLGCHVEHATRDEANNECSRIYAEVSSVHSGPVVEEGDGAEAIALGKERETRVEAEKLGRVGDGGSSDVIDVLKHDSATVISCTALSLCEKKMSESKIGDLVENIALPEKKVEIGGEVQSTSMQSGENASTKAERSFTFDVSALAGSSKGVADKSAPNTPVCHVAEAGDGVHSTSGSKQIDHKMIVQEISHGSPQIPDKVAASGSAKGERKARRGSSKSGKESVKKGNQVKELTPLKQSARGDKSRVPFSPSGSAQRMQFETRSVELSSTKSSGFVSVPTSNLPDLNTSSPSSVFFHQPFTDLQQVQLRAQIFVYGSLIQGAAPDEACMASAFGASDGGRSVWEPAWRACVERIHGQKSHAGNNETPLRPHSEMRNAGHKTPDQANKQVAHQSKVTPEAGRVSSKGINPPVSPIIPLSSPLWNMPTPSCDGLLSNTMARGAVIDYKALSPMHPYQTPPVRNFAGHTASWLPQAPFPGPWVASPQTSAFDVSARFPALRATEPVKLTPVKGSSLTISSGAKHAPQIPVANSGDTGNLAEASSHDNKRAPVLPAQHPADQKSRKRKKTSGYDNHAQKSLLGTPSESVPAPAIGTQLSRNSPASDHFGQSSLVARCQTAPASAPIAGGLFSTSVAITSSSAPKSNSDILITSVSSPSSTDLSKGDLASGKKSLSSEVLNKVEEAKLQAEEASACAAAAVSHCQAVWGQLDKHKSSGLVSDIETKLTSAAVAVAAAASVAKAAAAAAKIASNAALQAKLMAEEALVACGTSNPSQTNAVSFPVIANNLGSPASASILKGGEVSNDSGSIIFVAREAARRRIEAASAASRHAENLDAIVKAAELAADAVSHAGKVVAMGDPLPLSQLVEAGPDSYWKVSQELSGQGVEAKKVNGDKSDICNVEKDPVTYSKQSEGPSVEATLPTIPASSPQLGGVSGNIIDNNMKNDEVISDSITCLEKDIRGEMSHCKSESSKTVGVFAESGSDSKLASNVQEACGDMASSKMKEGSLVEVFKDCGDGKRVWFTANVLSLKNGKALVSYTDLQSDEGSEQLKDWVPLDADGDEPPIIRAAHPMTAMQGAKKRRRAAAKEYTWYVGDRVDAWIDNRWREGVIVEKNKRDETTFGVNFPAHGDTAVVRAWHLRPSLIWKDGEWVEWSSSRQDFVSQGDTPKEKRMKLGNSVSEDRVNDTISKNVDPVVPVRNEPAKLLPLSANEKTFNIGRNKDDSKPNTLRTMRSGLQKEGSNVFGVPKPGKKRKFMDVSKHYVSDRGIKNNAANDSSKFTKYLMPQATGAGGWKINSRTDSKERQLTEAKLKPPKPKKLPSSNRNLKDNSFKSTADAISADHVVGDAIDYDKNEPGQPNVVNSVSNAEGASGGPMEFSSEARPTNIPRKASTSSNKVERFKRNPVPANLKATKIEGKDKLIPEVNEPRRSNRKIQPTSRLLEGLQSSLIISKFPSVSHDKSNRGQSKGASR